MSLTIKKAGLLSTIQDMGRLGYAHFGVPVSGAMDMVAAKVANQLVSNLTTEAMIEVTWQGISFTVTTDVSIAVAGAEFDCTVNNESISTDQTIALKSGDEFSMERLQAGVRAYIAFAGGLDIESVLSSRSTLISAGMGGYQGRSLEKDDVIKLLVPEWVTIKKKSSWQIIKQQTIHVIRAMPGPEMAYFSEEVQHQAFGQAYQLSNQSDRMGFRLESGPLAMENREPLVSSGLLAGSLQVTPDGQTILAMKDAQTTGGYPRILVVNQAELSKLAQVRQGELIYFFRS